MLLLSWYGLMLGVYHGASHNAGDLFYYVLVVGLGHDACGRGVVTASVRAVAGCGEDQSRARGGDRPVVHSYPRALSSDLGMYGVRFPGGGAVRGRVWWTIGLVDGQCIRTISPCETLR